MTLYTRFQSTASRLLNKFEQGTVKLVARSFGHGPGGGGHGGGGGAGDPWNPTGGSETEYPQNAVVKGVSQRYIGMETGGGLIVASDLELLVPGGGQVPHTADEYDIDGDRYQILKVDPIPAAGTVSLYRVIVRK